MQAKVLCGTASLFTVPALPTQSSAAHSSTPAVNTSRIGRAPPTASYSMIYGSSRSTMRAPSECQVSLASGQKSFQLLTTPTRIVLSDNASSNGTNRSSSAVSGMVMASVGQPPRFGRNPFSSVRFGRSQMRPSVMMSAAAATPPPPDGNSGGRGDDFIGKSNKWQINHQVRNKVGRSNAKKIRMAVGQEEAEADVFVLLDHFFHMKFDDREQWLQDFRRAMISDEQRAKHPFVANSIALRLHIKQTGISEIRKDPVMRLFARYCDSKFKQHEATADERLQKQSHMRQMYKSVQSGVRRRLDSRTRDGTGATGEVMDKDVLDETVAKKIEQYNESLRAAADAGNTIAEDIVQRAREDSCIPDQLERNRKEGRITDLEFEHYGWGSHKVTKIDLSDDNYIKKYILRSENYSDVKVQKHYLNFLKWQFNRVDEQVLKSEAAEEKEQLCKTFKLNPQSEPPATRMIREIRKLLEVQECSLVSQDQFLEEADRVILRAENLQKSLDAQGNSQDQYLLNDKLKQLTVVVEDIREYDRKIHEKRMMNQMRDYMDRVLEIGTFIEQKFASDVQGKKILRGYDLVFDGESCPYVTMTKAVFLTLSEDQQRMLVSNFDDYDNLRDIGVTAKQVLKIAEVERQEIEDDKERFGTNDSGEGPGGVMIDLAGLGFTGRIVSTKQPGQEEMADVRILLGMLHEKLNRYLLPASIEMLEHQMILNQESNYRQGSVEDGNLTGQELMKMSERAQNAYTILREDFLMRILANKFAEKQKLAGSPQYKELLKNKNSKLVDNFHLGLAEKANKYTQFFNQFKNTNLNSYLWKRSKGDNPQFTISQANELIQLHNEAMQTETYGFRLFHRLIQMEKDSKILSKDIENIYFMSIEWPLDMSVELLSDE